jgi:hypothetical protein
MKTFTGITLMAGLLLTGCSSQLTHNKTLYLKTEMQSSVSGKAGYTDPVDSLLKESRVRHFRFYSLGPLPGKTYHDELDRTYTAVIMYIDLVKGKAGYTAEISGDINYYDTQRYVNGKLVGDVIKSVPIPLKTVTLGDQKTLSVELPRGIRFTAQLSEDAFSDVKS